MLCWLVGPVWSLWCVGCVLYLLTVLCAVVAALCHPGAHAGADVPAQNLQPQPQRLPEDVPLPEVAEDGGTTR